MKNKPFFVILALGLLCFSCDDVLTMNGNTPAGYEGLEQRSFWAQNMQTNQFYQTRAARLYEGEKCVIWAELDSAVTKATAEAIAREYDGVIASTIVNIFGMDDIQAEEKLIGNSLEYADYLTDLDGKLTVLLLDIKDGYTKNGDSYTAGYFWAGNFYTKKDVPSSNEADMMYIDTNPSVPGSSDSHATFAHELQHLINYVNGEALGRSYSMDTWIDEGLSLSAEYIYLGYHTDMRYWWFIQDSYETIRRGNNFFVWDNHQETAAAIMDEYATAYLFFQWLRLQSGGGNEIYTDIARSTAYNQRAVLNAAQTRFDEDAKQYAADWETLLRTWMAANYINSASGPYGYKDEPSLREVRVWAIGGQNQNLYPGEGVYSVISGGSTNITASGHIKYGGLTKNRATSGAVDFEGSSYSGERLLTFNMNGDKEGGTETGRLTGGRADQTASVLAASRQAWEPASLRIDARDISGSFRQEERELFRRLGKAGEDAAK